MNQTTNRTTNRAANRAAMQRSFSKRYTCLTAAYVMAASIALATPVTARADTSVLYQTEKYETATSCERKYYDAYVEVPSKLGVGILLPDTATTGQKSILISVLDKDGSVIGTKFLTNDSQWGYIPGACFAPVYFDIQHFGHYKVQLEFSEDVTYGVMISANDDNITTTHPDSTATSAA